MIQTDYFPLAGGLNQMAPPLATQPGEVLDGANYELIATGGYRRILGYELYDGSNTPSPVPGVGPVRGLHLYKGDLYAFRDDATNGRMYKATASGWTEVNPAFTWSTGGTYRCISYNFYGQDSDQEMFIVNGINKAVRFDGTNLTQITTGTGTDNPKLVAGYKTFLFLAIESSLLHSESGDPSAWDAQLGAGEIAVGDTITDLQAAPSALIVGCQDTTKMLTGDSSLPSAGDPFRLDELTQIGPYFGTLANIGGQIIGLDRQGVMSLSASQAYGNFGYASLSQKVKTYIGKFKDGAVALINRNSSQYRIYNGNVGLYFTFAGQQLAGIMRVVYDHVVNCACNGESSLGDEQSFIGDTNGNVFILETGYTFNGEPINAYLVSSFHNYGSPTVNKRFRMLMPDLKVEGNDCQLSVSGTTNYAKGLVSRGLSEPLNTTAGALYDYSNWDEFLWDSYYHHDAKIRLNLTGQNLAVLISSTSNLDSIHTIYGITIHWSQRRMIR